MDHTKEKINSVEERIKGEKKGRKKRNEMKTKKRKEKKSVLGKRKKKGERRVGHALFGSRCSDCRKLIGRELKLVDSSRATSRCKKHKEVGFSPTLVPLNPRVLNNRVVQPQPWD